METYAYSWGKEFIDILKPVNGIQYEFPTDIAINDNCVVIKSKDSCGAAVNHSIYTLGLSLTADANWIDGTPRLLSFPSSYRHVIKQVAAGSNHILVLSVSHELFASGSGHYGELGLGQRIGWVTNLVQVDFLCNDMVDFIAAGNHCSAFITESGKVYTYGSGAYYRLGHGTDKDVLLPTIVQGLIDVGDQLINGTSAGVSTIAIGSWHMIVITKGTNDIYGWGWNKFCQLGFTLQKKIIQSPIRIEELDSPELLGDSIPSMITCGSRHTAILCHNSTKIIIM